MIKFFRKIRYDLIGKNPPDLRAGKTGKYLKYAIGEIILVVIGILIALQINNWNDNKTLVKKERALLLEMKSNLESDLIGLKWDIRKNEDLLLANQIVLNSLNTGAYDDSLSFYFAKIKGNTVFVKNTSAFENLNSIGLDIIQNDSLRMKITRLYSENYDYIRYMEQVRDEKFQYEQIIPQIFENLTRVSEFESRPINFSELQHNHKFKEMIKYNCGLRGYFIEVYKRIEKMIYELIDEIELELDN